MRNRAYRWMSMLLAIMLLSMSVITGRAYAQVLTEDELGAIQGSQVLIDDLAKPGATLNPEAPAYGNMESVTVEGQSFNKAIRFNTVAQPASTYLLQYELPIEGAIAKDDVLLATFYARTVSSTVETGEGQMSLVLEKTGTWEKSLTETVAIPVQWKKFIVPIKAAVDMPAGESHITLRLGFKPQVIEVADLKLINFMKAVTFDQLPSTPVTYEGMEDDAPWRAEAEQRIEQYRKGDFGITVTDEQGSPIEGADVHIAMTNHEFKFGTAVNSSMLLGTDANAEIYRTKLKENFNSVVMENEMKWPWWEADKAKAVQTYNWLGQNGFSIRGHNLLWDNASRLPADIPGLLDDKDQLEQRIEDHIHETAGYFRGRVQDWDVLNEPVLNHLIRDKYGDAFAAEWFKEAREADPSAKLFVNETQILGVDAPVIANFSTILQNLKANGAPIDGVGIQAHFGSTPVSPMAFYNQVTHFAQYAPEVAITEFDMNSPREDVQGQFTRDLLIAMFSHPNVTSFTMWGFWDGAHWQNNAPLFRSDWSLKPSGEAWRDLVYGEWWTDVAGSTDASGKYKTRGFFGDYDITVTYEGVSRMFSRSFLKNGPHDVSIVLDGEEEQPEVFQPLAVPGKSAQITAPVWPYNSGSSFNASQPSPTSVTLTWPAAKDDTGVKGYRIYNNGALLTETAANVTKTDVTGLIPGNTYSFEIEAFDKDGNVSVRSGKLIVTTPVGEDHTLPGWKKGSFLTVTELDEGSAKLSWPAGVDDGTVSGYKVYVNGQLEGDTAATTFKLDGLQPYTLYVARVEAKDEEGNLSPGGPIVMFTTPGAADEEGPTWPQPALTVSGKTATGLTLAWEPAYDAGGIAAYRVFDGTVELVTLPPTAASYQVNGISGGSNHTYRVEALDHAGNWSSDGPAAYVDAAGREDTASPAWPSERKLSYSSLTDKSVTLSWTPAEDDIGVTRYQIYIDDTEAAIVEEGSREYTVSSLQPGQTYSIRVEAGDAAGHWTSGGPVLEVTASQGVVRTEQQIAPSDDVFIQAPAVFGGEGTNNKDLAYLRYKNAAGVSESEQNKNTGNNRRVYMKFPLDDVEGRIYFATLNVYVYAVQTPNMDIGMNVYAAGDDWTESTLNWSNKPADGDLIGSTTVRNSGYWKSIPVTDYVIREANGDKAVSFKLTDDSWLDQNVDMYSKEAVGAVASFRPYLSVGTEAVPHDVNPPVWENGSLAADIIHPKSALLSWTAADDDLGVNGYRIYQDGTAIDTVSADVYSYRVTGLIPGTAYTFKVEALDAIQESSDGPAVSVTMPGADTAPPVWPEASAPELSGVKRNGAQVSWVAADDQYGVEEYILYVDGSAKATVSGDTYSYALNGLLPGQSYSIRVAAADAAGNEAKGEESMLHTAAADSEPPQWPNGSELTSAGITESGIWLNWPAASDNTGIASYRIYEGDQSIALVSGDVRSYFAAGLRDKTDYSFRVVAADEAGNTSEPLILEDIQTLARDLIYPQWPTGSRISSEITDEGLHLQWDSATDNIGISGYRLYRNGVAIAETDGTTRVYTDTANQDTQAVYKVEARDSVGNWSVFGPSTTDSEYPVPADTRPPVWPASSVIIPVQVTSTLVDLKWTAAVDQTGVTGYRVYVDGKLISEVEGTEWTVNNLIPGAAYTFKVEAVDEAGNVTTNGPTLQLTTTKPSTGVTPDPKPDVGLDTDKAIIAEDGNGQVSIGWKSGTLPKDGVFRLESPILEDAFARAERDQAGQRLITIHIPALKGISGYEIELPAKSIKAGNSSDRIALESEWGTLYLPGNMLANNPAITASEQVTLNVQQAYLPSGSIPYGTIAGAIELSISVNGKIVAYDNPQAPVKVSLAYQASTAELHNPDLLTVWYVDPAGNASWVRSGHYDLATGEMTFTASHFSTYAIAFVSRTFDDLNSYEWARKSIEKLAARHIIQGVSETLYRPGVRITRADFVKLLVETLGLQSQSRTSFNDVPAAAYYADALGIAGSLGIAAGSGDGKFHPGDAITRQEMFALVARSLQQLNKPLPQAGAEVTAKFKDSSSLAAYSKEAAAALVQAGLVEGSNGMLYPSGDLNRAEAAVMMDRLFDYVFN